jgi:membrane-bound ClpP family serine protease
MIFAIWMPDQVRHDVKEYFFVMLEKLRKIPGRVYLRYLLLMLPGVVILILVLMIIEHWVVMPAWLFWAVVFLWLAKEVVIFPFVWHAHDPHQPGISRSMIGAFGIVKERLDPAGYIQVAGELWKAEHIETAQPIEKGERVRVVKMEGLKLFVALKSPEDKS